MAFMVARVKSRCSGFSWPRKTLLAGRPLWMASLSSSICSSCCSRRACSQRSDQASERKVAGMASVNCSAL